ncbi:MAG: tetratricopeptide repeat protein [Rhizobiaceae bacterium]|nr:tetratricopeptide repeat protein [Rhizobiaceae bacterium]
MSDDSFFREVEEELRSDRIQGFWERYKYIIISAAVLIVLATAGYRFWEYYSRSLAADSGDAFIAAVELSNDGQHEEAIAALNELVEQGSGEYPALAKIRLAAEYAKNGDSASGVEAFDAIANDAGFDQTLRNVARLRAGLLLVDNGTYDEVRDRLEQMAGDTGAFRHSAREGLGLSAWKHGELEDSHRWFTAIMEDGESPQGVRQRAAMMLELLAGRGINGPQSETG